MKSSLFLIVIIMTLGNFAFSSEADLIILIDGKIHKVLKSKEIKNLKSVKIDYYDHILRTTEFYRGVPFLDLVNLSTLGSLDNIVEIELISTNGYKTYFPMESFKKFDSVLTYDTADGRKFERYSQKEKTIISLAPYYLIWNSNTLKNEDRYLYGSVYQISQINFISNDVDFGVHDSKVNESVILGFRTYKKYCLSCHAIGTWGGDLSIDLVKNKSLEKKGTNYILKYILTPESLNKSTKMRPLPKYKNSQEMAEGIIAFLNFSKNSNEYIKKEKIDSNKFRYEAFKTMMNEMRNKK